MAKPKKKKEQSTTTTNGRYQVDEIRHDFFERFTKAMTPLIEPHESEYRTAMLDHRVCITEDLDRREVVFWASRNKMLNNLQVFTLLEPSPIQKKPLIFYATLNRHRLFFGPRLRWSRNCMGDNTSLRLELVALPEELPALAEWFAELIDFKESGEDGPQPEPPIEVEFTEDDYIWTQTAGEAYAEYFRRVHKRDRDR